MSARRLLLFIPFVVLIAACNADDFVTEPSPKPEVWGTLSAIKHQRTQINGTDTNTAHAEIAMAYMLANPSVPNVFVDAGDLKINDIIIDQNTDNSYVITAEPGASHTTLNLDNDAFWFIPGTFFATYSFHHSDPFPEYIEPIPFEIVKANGISFTFDSTTLTGADSVRVFIDDGTTVIQKVFSAKAGDVIIEPADLTSLQFVSNHSASLGIFPYKGAIRVNKGQAFFFIKERRIYHSINIL